MKILLHICCAPCSIHPLDILQSKFDVVLGYFYRHNIHPFSECMKRESAVRQYVDSLSIKVILQKNYRMETFIQNVVFREKERCFYCYHDRIVSSAIIAKKGDFDCFSTTLLYSKFQNHKLIRSIGESVSKKIKIPFYYYDFRNGWKQGIKKSKILNMYRQNYCGCIYSEKESVFQVRKGTSDINVNESKILV